MKNTRYLLILLAAVLLLPSCVSSKKYKDLTSQHETLMKKYNDLQTNYNGLDSKYATLNDEYNNLTEGKEAYEKMSQQELAALTAQLNNKITALEATSKQVADLTQIIQKQRDAQKDLLNKIDQALIGFTPDQLSVEMRDDGKIYVSLSEKLLFKTGKWDVDPAGKLALQKVAIVLMEQPDIEIQVEGHTDNVPLKGSVVKDNWDLSVMRATSVARILTKDYGVNPKQVSANGRGEFFPIASNDTEEGKAKNRRTEIILSPKISDLMKMISQR